MMPRVNTFRNSSEQVPERYHCEAKLEIKKLALTKPQIKKWKLPWIWIPKPKPEHMKKKYVSDYWKENGQQKVELDAVSGVKLTNLIEKRLGKILDWSIVEQSEEQSKSAVSKWKEQHGID